MIPMLVVVAVLGPILVYAAMHKDRTELLAAVRADCATQLAAAAADRRELLNRIKPETAQYAAPTQTLPELDIPFDDDAAYAKYAHMTKEELAELNDGSGVVSVGS